MRIPNAAIAPATASPATPAPRTPEKTASAAARPNGTGASSETTSALLHPS